MEDQTAERQSHSSQEECCSASSLQQFCTITLPTLCEKKSCSQKHCTSINSIAAVLWYAENWCLCFSWLDTCVTSNLISCHIISEKKNWTNSLMQTQWQLWQLPLYQPLSAAQTTSSTSEWHLQLMLLSTRLIKSVQTTSKIRTHTSRCCQDIKVKGIGISIRHNMTVPSSAPVKRFLVLQDRSKWRVKTVSVTAHSSSCCYWHLTASCWAAELERHVRPVLDNFLLCK